MEEREVRQGESPEHEEAEAEAAGAAEEAAAAKTEAAGEESEATEQEQPQEETPAEPDPKDAELAALNNRLLRLQADFDNYRRRTKAESEELGNFVTAQVVAKFLKVLDNFERAEANASAAPESLLKGLNQIKRQFETALKELGVSEIAALGEKFDPNIHEAVLRGQDPNVADETIDLVLEKGYRLGNKVIRHSKVRVITNE